MAVAVQMYTTEYCASCVRAKQLLARKGVDVREIDVSEDRGDMIHRTGRMTVPQIFIGDFHVGGYDDLIALHRNGSLDRLLAGEVPLRTADGPTG